LEQLKSKKIAKTKTKKLIVKKEKKAGTRSAPGKARNLNHPVFGRLDHRLNHRSKYSDKIKFNHVKAANHMKCEWIFLKKIDGVNRHWTRIGSDLNLVCHVNNRLLSLGFDALVPEVGTDYIRAKEQGFAETFIHPGFLDTLNKDQKKQLLDGCALLPAHDHKGRPTHLEKRKKSKQKVSKKSQSYKPKVKLERTDDTVVENMQQSMMQIPKISSSAVKNMPKLSRENQLIMLNLQTEGYDLFQQFSIWLQKITKATETKDMILQSNLMNLQNEGYELLQKFSTWIMRISDILASNSY